MMGWNAFFVGAHPGAINGSSLSTAFAPGCALQGTGRAARIIDSCYAYYVNRTQEALFPN